MSEPTQPTDWQLALKPGDRVRVLDDHGDLFDTVVKHAPWQLSHGAWVVGLKGQSGGYLLGRVQCVIVPEPTCNQEIEAAELAVRACPHMASGTCSVCQELAATKADLDRLRAVSGSVQALLKRWSKDNRAAMAVAPDCVNGAAACACLYCASWKLIGEMDDEL